MYWQKVSNELFIVSESEGRYFTDACGNPYAVYVYPQLGKVKLCFITDNEFVNSHGLDMLSEARALLAKEAQQ